MGVFAQIQREGQMDAFASGPGHRTGRGETAVSLLLPSGLHKTLDRHLPLPGPLGDLDISCNAVVPLV